MKIVSWFSAGVSSFVASWLLRKEIDEIIYCHIDDQHEDSLRFLSDCEKLFERKIKIIQSHYKSVDAVLKQTRFINGPHGASCTRILKKRTRIEWEASQNVELIYVWGIDFGEKHRTKRIIIDMPSQSHLFPLIEKGLTKQDCHGIAGRLGLKRPMLYDLGFFNNNCIGCVKQGMFFWNLTRKYFPEIFKLRSERERLEGHV